MASYAVAGSARRAFLVISVLFAHICGAAVTFKFECGPTDCHEHACCSSAHYVGYKKLLLNKPASEKASMWCHREDDQTLQPKTVFLYRSRQVSGSVFANRTYKNYMNGFSGPANGWMGLNALHRVTAKWNMELYINLKFVKRFMNKKYLFVRCADFRVGSKTLGYTLWLGTCSPSGKENMINSAGGQRFSAPDNDYTGAKKCAKWSGSGWWFANCGDSNLNGLMSGTGFRGMHWGSKTLSLASMAMQPAVAPTGQCCPNTCQNGGTCKKHDTKKKYVCRCPPGFTGWQCKTTTTVTSAPAANATSGSDNATTVMSNDTTASACGNTSNACLNGGNCSANGLCACAADFTGRRCETPLSSEEPNLLLLVIIGAGVGLCILVAVCVVVVMLEMKRKKKLKDLQHRELEQDESRRHFLEMLDFVQFWSAKPPAGSEGRSSTSGQGKSEGGGNEKGTEGFDEKELFRVKNESDGAEVKTEEAIAGAEVKTEET
ncbi:hypothetical protein LSAT2_012921 [Lamellibrachia satsuma]|nr:hypothetical protein LSAT2_012921 [Lamellibrachia satsuma]